MLSRYDHGDVSWSNEGATRLAGDISYTIFSDYMESETFYVYLP